MIEVNADLLIKKAEEALPNSYAPYSNVHVASAVLDEKGNIHVGVNVENSSYGLTICAERSAIAAMVANGARKPIAVAIVTDLEEPIPPCGACRQVISEFNKDALIIMYSIKSRRTVVAKLSELFPSPFTLKSPT